MTALINTAELVVLAQSIATRQIFDAEGAPIPELVNFYCVDVYWEFQLYAGVTSDGLTKLWKLIQHIGESAAAAVMNFYTEFRAMGQLGSIEWNELVTTLAHSLSLLNRPVNYAQGAMPVIAKDYVDRSLSPDKVAELLHHNAWVVPLLMLKMGPPLITTKQRSRKGGGHTSM